MRISLYVLNYVPISGIGVDVGVIVADTLDNLRQIAVMNNTALLRSVPC